MVMRGAQLAVFLSRVKATESLWIKAGGSAMRHRPSFFEVGLFRQVAHGLDIVPIGIEHKSPVIVLVVVGTQTRRTIVFAP